MAFDLQEQEQIAEMKAWWHDYGRHIALAVVGVLVVYAGWQGWQGWQKSQASKAAAVFTQVESSVGDTAKLKAAVEALKRDYAGSPYASRAALLAAREAFAKSDLTAAKNELNWVLNHSSEALARDLARQRLAAILLDESKADEALKLIERPEVEGMEAAFAEARGDLYAVKGDKEKAREAYKAALSKQDKSAQNFVEMKLDALGQ